MKVSEIFQHVVKLLGIEHYTTVPYHQQGDPAERYVQVAQRVLRTMSATTQRIGTVICQSPHSV